MPHQIKVTDELYDRLKARAAGQPIPQLIRGLLDGEDLKEVKPVDKTMDEGERLLEQLDNKNENPEDYISEEDKAVLRGLGPGELPACCQTIFDDPEHPVPTCKHWRQAYENYYGQKMWGYVNDLVGGGYRTWFSKYVK